MSIKYSATINDKETTIRMVILPDGEKYWLVIAKAFGETNFEPFEKSIKSFHLDSTETISKPILKPNISVPNFQIPFDSEIVLEKNIDVNLILVGEKWSSSVKSSVQSNLPIYRDPIYVESDEKTGIRHIYNYNFVSVSDEEVKELSDFMTKNSSPMPIFGSTFDYPIWQAYWVAANHPEWVNFDYYGNVENYNIDYRLVDALAIEEYVYEKFVGSNPDLSNPTSVNLVFVAMDLEDADFLRNYSTSNKDDASGETFSSMGLMGYGGNYNMLFFDLYAAPWFDIDTQTWEYVFPPWVETLHDCNTNQCFTELITYHASEALQYVISPHLLYPIKNADKYVIEALVYTKPGGPNTVTPQTMSSFVDEEKVLKELEFLYPFSDWEINFSLERRDTRGLPYEMKQELEHTSHFNFENIFGEEKLIQILDVDKIQPHLITWAETQRSDLKVFK